MIMQVLMRSCWYYWSGPGIDSSCWKLKSVHMYIDNLADMHACTHTHSHTPRRKHVFAHARTHTHTYTHTHGWTKILYFTQLALRCRSSDTISQISTESSTSADSKDPVYIAAGDIRRRLSENISAPKKKFEVGCIIWIKWGGCRMVCLSAAGTTAPHPTPTPTPQSCSHNNNNDF